MAAVRIYIAGPMTGIAEYNYPAFMAAAKSLRTRGFHVENPAENPAPKCGTWQGYMRLAIAQLVKCDSMLLLPGWSASRGATIEHRIALDLGMTIYVGVVPWPPR